MIKFLSTHQATARESGFEKPRYSYKLFVNNQLDAKFFFVYVYFYSLHVSGSHVPIIRIINSINKISGICHPV